MPATTFTHWGDTVDLQCDGKVHSDGLVHFYVVNGDWDGRYDPTTKIGWSVAWPKSTFFMGDMVCHGA